MLCAIRGPGGRPRLQKARCIRGYIERCALFNCPTLIAVALRARSGPSMRAWEGAILELHALDFAYILTLQKPCVLHYAGHDVICISICILLCFSFHLDEATCTAQIQIWLSDPGSTLCCRRGLAQAPFSSRPSTGHEFGFRCAAAVGKQRS